MPAVIVDHPTVADAMAMRKREADAIARAALAGFDALRLGRGYVIRRWNLSRELPDVQALERFLKQAGA